MRLVAILIALCLLAGCIPCVLPPAITAPLKDPELLGSWDGYIWPLDLPPIPATLYIDEQRYTLTIIGEEQVGYVSGPWGTDTQRKGLNKERGQDPPPEPDRLMQWSVQCTNIQDVYDSDHFAVLQYEIIDNQLVIASPHDFELGQGTPDQTGSFYTFDRVE